MQPNVFSKSIFLFVLFYLTINFAFSQDCNCGITLRNLQEKVEANYAGYDDKVNKKTSETYRKVVSVLVQRATPLNNGKDCQVILEAYIDFFKDPHLQLEDKYTSDKVSVETKQFPNENVNIYYQNLELTEKDIRGVWKNDIYELAIINAEQPNWYEALVINSENKEWTKGMVKMRLKKVNTNLYEIKYITGDFEAFATKGYFTQNILDILSVGVFEKVEPELDQKLDIKTYESIFPDEEIKFTFPDDSTAILFISSFRNQNEAIVDSLMKANKQDLEKRPIWIIDISYNGGGGTGTYKALLPYLNTSTIKRSGSYYRLSRENTQKFEQFLIDNPNLPPAVNSFFSKLVIIGKQKPNTWYFEKGKELTFNKIEENPKKIGVLVSEKTASSGEIFVMDAIQSKKVTVFGTQTKGVVDYGDGMTHIISCDSIKVLIPTRRSEYLKYTRYDSIGLKPDVQIAEENLKPYDFILEYFAKKSKGRKSKK